MTGKRAAGGNGRWARRKARRARRKARPKTWKTRLFTVVKWGFAAGLVLVLVAVGAFVYKYRTTDLPDPNAAFLTQTTRVYYDDGKSEVGEFAVQHRTSLDFDQMPQDIKDAVVAAENKTFWSDNGIDLKSIVRAAVSNARGNATQGASTITQQYVKIVYLNQERSYARKIDEAILSLKLEREQSKEEILQGYLNAIYFGRGAYGIEAAAHAYFDEDAKDLSLKQAAVLAAVLNNPTQFDPAGGREHRQALKARYDYVLQNMVELSGSGDPEVKGITEGQARRAMRRLPAFPDVSDESAYGGQRGFMLSMVKDALLGLRDSDGKPLLSQAQVDGGGLKVETTFDRQAMKAAKAGVMAERPTGKEFSDKHLHVAVASVEPGTGALRGFYAGQDYLRSQINWAVAGGQAGSTFKPFALATALKSGYSLRSTFDGNSPITLADGSEVGNESDHSYGSAVSLLYATEESINTAYVDLTSSIPDGPQKIIDTAEAMGIPPRKAPRTDPYGFPDHTPGLNPDTTVALGSQTVSPINMANGYATIANGGVAAEPFVIEKVTDPDGKVLYRHQVQTHRAVSADVAADDSYAMQQTVEHGTGTAALALGRPAAGKTGTATNGLDQVSSAWFAGFTPQLSTAVMYVRGTGVQQLDGYLPEFFGAAYPARTWTAVMEAEMKGLPIEQFPDPADLVADPPESGHTYVPPAAPTRKSKPRHTQTNRPSSAPQSSAPPTRSVPTSRPTSAPPSSAPPTSAPPTQPPTSAPTSDPTQPSPPPTSPAAGPGGGGTSSPQAARRARRH